MDLHFERKWVIFTLIVIYNTTEDSLRTQSL